MDVLSKVLLETIESVGYAVKVEAESVTAIDSETGKRFIVRHDPVSFYDACVELAVIRWRHPSEAARRMRFAPCPS